MHSCEHIFQQKSEHPEIWGSVPSLPLAVWWPSRHHLLAFPFGSCALQRLSKTSIQTLLSLWSLVLHCRYLQLAWTGKQHPGEIPELRDVMYGTNMCREHDETLSTTLCEEKSCWCNQGHSWGCQRRGEGFCWPVFSTGLNGLKVYHPESRVPPALGSKVL